MEIPDYELNFSFAKSGGAGGQNVNKLNTKATLTWFIDNSSVISGAHKKRFKQKYSSYINSDGAVKITSQRYRTQNKNISDCLEKLNELLDKTRKPPKKRISTKPTKSSIRKRITEKKNKGELKKKRQKVSY